MDRPIYWGAENWANTIDRYQDYGGIVDSKKKASFGSLFFCFVFLGPPQQHSK